MFFFSLNIFGYPANVCLDYTAFLLLNNITNIRKHFHISKFICNFFSLLRERDSNPRPYGYEPHELPLLYPAIYFKERYSIYSYLYIYKYTEKILNLQIFLNNFKVSGFIPYESHSRFYYYWLQPFNYYNTNIRNKFDIS